MYKNTNNANYQDATTSPTMVQVLTGPQVFNHRRPIYFGTVIQWSVM